ncbi:MAG: 30S ribosomal protein S2 [uncultured bacterium]|uniref:Small ribosomal subunit protein uS2 n=1 Tax=Candidatus Daviesbacteria bacterium GW2011_GWC2_40_12 TaxID=1618431 RepID=A0A0G0QNH2_9BACT|nr:MAG: 30S ribosomal protein S2 [uncultured bacterium]KKQ84621.1 MAG: 30S ribosomal protein S2 [Candidatus Daviesbacteria bacterium GW2011_GWF2_38_7]KKR16200.1 MAG: 30S ribosomal protein S2 [Candidatus Daviesbacteria bacterium GW2011_GWA2_39_33]KKR25061.1 MAG: 30S ribosomal protein S2 [Candidatus Daviesbacteria bacterium GW2011_GWB1_39_5]KKR41979.1 MAG: 30S ribosomal protein S2 [Candidatus Daviesbacteria bacterium GW2011_GWC2_40_12]OGE21731.1 MAG: 30S ribosomal protein S2 [Candidatus Daviesba
MYKLPTLQELLEAGVHFGHQVRRGHPRMKPYIYGAKDGVSVIDLTQSEKYLKEACEFVYNLGKEGKVLLFVGTKKQAQPIIEEEAKKLEAPFLTHRWMGGFLTNFEEIKKNIKKLKEYLDQKEKGTLSKYTKKEQLLLERKMAKLQSDFAGVMNFPAAPEALFVVDAVSDNIAIREANRLKIKVVAIADSNCDPTEIDYPIPGNDDAIKSIKILVGAVASAFEEGKKEAGKAAVKAAEKAEKDAKKLAGEEEVLDDKLKEDVAAVEELVEKKAVKESARVVE